MPSRSAMPVGLPIRHSSSHVGADDFAYVRRIAKSNFVGEGPFAESLRKRLATVFGRPGVVLTNSGTAALELALHQLRTEAPRRRLVAVSAYVCPAVVNAILRADLKPLFADIEPRSLNLDVASLRDRVDDRLLAIILTHPGGVPDDCKAAESLALPVISDCAQGVGAMSAGRPVTQYGRTAVLSFGPTKPFTAGTGGAILMDDAAMLEELRVLARGEHDVAHYRRAGFHVSFGQQFADVNAGLGLSQLSRFDRFLRRRRAIARRYDKVLLPAGCLVPGSDLQHGERNGFRYVMLSDHAVAWLDLLRGAGIDARPSIAHDMTAYFPGLGRLGNLRHQAPRVVSVPIHPRLTDKEVRTITSALRRGIDMGLR